MCEEPLEIGRFRERDSATCRERSEFLHREIYNFNTRSNLIASAENRGSQLKLDHHSPADVAGRFRTTRWSAVLLSAQIMELVEGETLENLIKRSGRLDVKLALEISTQVAAGLAAVHKQKLVHRDIKPSNIMVSVEEGSTVTAKIIDLGLAKPAPDAPAEAAISTPGAFAGTPESASPEQFAGVGVDIRSDPHVDQHVREQRESLVCRLVLPQRDLVIGAAGVVVVGHLGQQLASAGF